MFGLRVPISQSEQSDEFDSLATILSHSHVARSPKQQARSWEGSLANDGGIFHLELSSDMEASLACFNGGDGASISSLTLGQGCNSEDTGYSSDQDLGANKRQFLGKSLLAGSKKTAGNRDIQLSSGSKLGPRLPRVSENPNLQISSPTVVGSGESFAQPFAALECSDSLGIKKGHTTIQSAGPSWRDSAHTQATTQPCLDNDDGVCLTPSDLRSSTTSNVSCQSLKSGSNISSVSCQSLKSGSNISIVSCQSLKSGSTLNSVSCQSLKSGSSLNSVLCQSLKSGSTLNSVGYSGHLRKGDSIRTGSASSQCLGYQSIIVDIRLNSSRSSVFETNALQTPGVTLCKQLLGIIPGRANDCDTKQRNKSTDIIVKEIVHGSSVGQKTDISIGSVLHSVNGQEISWSNMEALLSSLSRLRKLKLTLRSRRAESSHVDLETLVNILTSDSTDLHALDKVAAMYISLEGVDSDSTNDGVIYSFPSEHNVLHHLSGLFYTLSHLVKDINTSNTIKNTTLSIDGQNINIAYLQEGVDILVFALPSDCASVLQLNALLLGFARLLRVLFGSIECVFRKELHTVFIDSILTYLFRQALTSPVDPSLLSPLSTSPDSKKGTFSPAHSTFVKYSHLVQAVVLSDKLKTTVDKTLSEFESSNFADMSEHFYGCRRQYSILGSTFFYCGQLVCSHLAKEDLQDLHLYLQHHGILELTARSSVAQFVAWKEVFPTRFCHEVADINNSFGYSEPSARWCWLIVGLKHGLFCSLLETIGHCLVQNPLSSDVFYVDQAKACLLQLQTPLLLAELNIRVNQNGSQSPVIKSDYCATYVNTTGEKMAHIFGDQRKMRSHQKSHFLSQTNCSEHSIGSDASMSSAEFDQLYQSPHGGKIYPVATDGNSSLTTTFPAVFPHLPVTHKLSSSRYPSLYQYCCLDGLEGTIIMGSDMNSPGIFHAQILHSFYQCCQQIHSHFLTNKNAKHSAASSTDDDDDQFDSITPDSHLRGVREHGILMTFNSNQTERVHKSKWSLEYWVVGRRIKRPSVREVYVCFHPSTPQNIIELAFRLSFGSFC